MRQLSDKKSTTKGPEGSYDLASAVTKKYGSSGIGLPPENESLSDAIVRRYQLASGPNPVVDKHKDKDGAPVWLPEGVRKVLELPDRMNTVYSYEKFLRAKQDPEVEDYQGDPVWYAIGDTANVSHSALKLARNVTSGASGLLTALSLAATGIAIGASIATAGAAAPIVGPPMAWVVANAVPLAAQFALANTGLSALDSGIAPVAARWLVANSGSDPTFDDRAVQVYKESHTSIADFLTGMFSIKSNLTDLAATIPKARQSFSTLKMTFTMVTEAGRQPGLKQWRMLTKLDKVYDFLSAIYDLGKGFNGILETVKTVKEDIDLLFKAASRAATDARDFTIAKGKEAWNWTKSTAQAVGNSIASGASTAWEFGKSNASRAWSWTKGVGSKVAGGARQAWGFAKSLPGRATSFASRMAGKFGAWALPDSTEIHSGRATRDGGVTGPFLPSTWSREALEIELLKFHKMGPEAAADELLGSGSAAIFVNGVHYPLDLHCRAAQEMADTYGVPIVGVWNASGKGHDIMGIKGTGFLRDWGQSVTDKMFSGFGMKVNPATETLKNLILKHGSPKSENGGLRILAHSQGTIITSEALRLARAEGAVLNDRIDVTTFGNAIHSMPTGVHDRHYVHQKDVIAASVGSGAGIAPYLGPINPALALGAAVADRYSPRFYDKVVSRFNPVGWGMNLLGKVFPSIGAHQATAPRTKMIEYPGGTRGPLSVEQHGLVWEEGAKSSYVQNTKNDVIQQWAARGYKGKAELQRSGWGDAPDVDAGALRQRLRKQGGLGLTVPAAVKGKLRPFLGFDPSAARIHTGPTAAEAASQLHAEAFTIGRDVFFGTGQYSPNTKEGLGLLGHELTHVGQQMGRSIRPQFFTQSGGDSMEAEAQTVGRRIASMAFSQDGDLQVDRFDLEVSLEDSFDRQAVARAEVIAATALDIARRRCSSVTLADTVLEQLHIEVELDLNVDSDSEAAQRVADSILEALAQNASDTAGPEVGSEPSQAPVEEGSDSDGLPEDWEGEPIVQASRKVPKPRGGGWKVVVVGSPSPAETESATDRRRLQFLNAAASQGKDKQTIWLVEGSGYRAGKIPESEIKRMSKGVAWMEFVEPGESLVEALNRFRLKSISSLNVYSHGLRGLVALRYGWGDALPDYGLTVDQIASLNPNVFAKNAKIRFDSCNTGVAGLDENTSVAQAFSDRTGADVQAWTGRTSYADLNRGKGGVRGSELSWSSDAFKELWSRTVSGGSPKLKTFHPRRSGIDSFSPGAVPTYGFTPVPPPFGPTTLKEPLKKETGQSPKVAEAPVSRTMAQNAESLTSTYSSKKVEYQMGAQYSDENLKSDCSHFVHDVLVKSGYEIPYQSTSMMSGSKYYDKTDSPVAGDVMVQGGHMGVYSGTEDDKGNPQGYQMGNSGAKLGSWGPKGWFNKDKDLIYYRPKSEYLKKSGGTQ